MSSSSESKWRSPALRETGTRTPVRVAVLCQSFPRLSSHADGSQVARVLPSADVSREHWLARGMKTRLLATSAAALFALTACGGSTDSSSATDSAASVDSTSSEPAPKAPGKQPSESNPLVRPTSSPSTTTEVGEGLGLDRVQKGFLAEATKKVAKYPDSKAGQAALTQAATRACAAIRNSGGGDAARDAIRRWAVAEGLNVKDGQSVLVVALVSICPEAGSLVR